MRNKWRSTFNTAIQYKHWILLASWSARSNDGPNGCLITWQSTCSLYSGVTYWKLLLGRKVRQWFGAYYIEICIIPGFKNMCTQCMRVRTTLIITNQWRVIKKILYMLYMLTLHNKNIQQIQLPPHLPSIYCAHDTVLISLHPHAAVHLTGVRTTSSADALSYVQRYKQNGHATTYANRQ